jgi:hypothetical protein
MQKDICEAKTRNSRKAVSGEAIKREERGLFI